MVERPRSSGEPQLRLVDSVDSRDHVGRQLPIGIAGGSDAASLTSIGAVPATERFERIDDSIVRIVRTRDGDRARSVVPVFADLDPREDLAAAFDSAWLRTPQAPPASARRGSVGIVDLFAGCGALSLGVSEACRALELDARHLFAVDFNATALETYGVNFPGAERRASPVETIFDGVFGSGPTASEAALRDRLGPVTLLIGGPPCQGNSNLNNHTRRADPKNDLYFSMARATEILGPEHVVIENVQGVAHDRGKVMVRTRDALERLGYRVSFGTLTAANLGVAQRRSRLFMLASRERRIDVEDIQRRFAAAERSIRWAIADLEDASTERPIDLPPTPTPINKARIDYLFDRDLHDLPDSQRPDCHRTKSHSYQSVYGRMQWDVPSPTITTGFGTMGQGRFVHPSRRRTITPHEAARLQFIPDFFAFAANSRKALQEMISNAVPPKLGYVVALELLR